MAHGEPEWQWAAGRLTIQRPGECRANEVARGSAGFSVSPPMDDVVVFALTGLMFSVVRLRRSSLRLGDPLASFGLRRPI